MMSYQIYCHHLRFLLGCGSGQAAVDYRLSPRPQLGFLGLRPLEPDKSAVDIKPSYSVSKIFPFLPWFGCEPF